MSGEKKFTPLSLMLKAREGLHHETASFDLTQLFRAHFSERPAFLPADVMLPRDKAADFLEDVKKLREGVPLQYLLGEWEFYGITLKVGPGVLIPRPDTEILVDTALKKLVNTPNPAIADLCSGSGAIAIALAVSRPDATCTAVELSEKAQEYLRENIERHRLQARITQLTADIHRALHLEPLDLMISNPPYLSHDEMMRIPVQVRHEPTMALAAEEDGMAFYPVLAQKGKEHLKPGGHLLVEVGINRADAVCAIFAHDGYEAVETFADLSGIRRCVCAKRPEKYPTPYGRKAQQQGGANNAKHD